MERLFDAILGTIKSVQDRLSARIDLLERRELPLPIPGRDGRDGAPGERGMDGKDGRDGTPGPAGPMGPAGPPGPAVDVTPLLAQIETLTRYVSDLTAEVETLRRQTPASTSWIDALDARLVAVETRELLPGPPGPAGKDGRDGLDGKDGAPGLAGKDGEDGEDGKDGAPGPAGKDGRDGRDGKDGRDGVDGLGFDDLEADLDVEAKRLIIRAIRDGRIKEWAWFLPFTRYRGVWEYGQSYLMGDQVTHAGSQWVATCETSAKPDDVGEPPRPWILSAKRGRDGKAGPTGPAGKDGKDGRPGRDLTQLGPDGGKW